MLITANAAVTMVTGAVVCRHQASFCSVLFFAFFQALFFKSQKVIKSIPRVWRAFREPVIAGSKVSSSCCL